MEGMEVPAHVPGYTVDGPLGTDGTMWAGHEDATVRGSRHDFCRWRIPRHGSERAGEVALLTAVDHPMSCRCSVSWTCPKRWSWCWKTPRAAAWTTCSQPGGRCRPVRS